MICGKTILPACALFLAGCASSAIEVPQASVTPPVEYANDLPAAGLEVPVEPDEGFTGLQYVYAFGVALYIEDEDRLSKIAVREAVRDENSLKIRLQNESDSFARLSNDRFILTQGDKRISLAGDNLTGVIDKSVLAPRATVLVTMDLSELDLAEGDVSVRVEERAD